MAYNKSYQTVIAGQVRENEGVPFFGKNKIATPAGVFAIVNLSADKQPKITRNALQSTGVGKAGTVSDNVGSYNDASYQAAMG